MDLKVLISFMTEKKFYYFSGLTNSKDNILYIDFSTVRDVKGNVMEFSIGTVYTDVVYYDKRLEEMEKHEFKQLQDHKVFKLINSLIS